MANDGDVFNRGDFDGFLKAWKEQQDVLTAQDQQALESAHAEFVPDNRLSALKFPDEVRRSVSALGGLGRVGQAILERFG